ncbi:MAG: TetR/AcrR family transcriptional regulator [Bacteroidetes bacterium]|nr:MAG: TetR/AcrR family transcriptional regulator [Bacteroidota bacterium]
MPVDDITRQRILEVAQEHFLRLGFSKVTMEEIATQLGISKKTLYVYFPSKEELLSEVMTTMQNGISTTIDAILNETSLDFVEKVRRMMVHGGMFHSKFSSHFWVDMQKNCPTVWRGCDDFRIMRMRANTLKIVNEGMESGFFRKDINPQIAVLIYTAAIQQLMTPEMLSQLPVTMQELFETIIKIVFEGILTDEARTKHLPTLIQHQSEK